MGFKKSEKCLMEIETRLCLKTVRKPRISNLVKVLHVMFINAQVSSRTWVF
jgi:hypothetical protein